MTSPLIKLPKLPFLKSKDALAVDIGTYSIKIAQLKSTGNRNALLKWGIIPIIDNSCDISPQERKNIAVSRLAEFLAKEKILTKNIITSVSGNQVIVRYVRFPKLSHDELLKTLRFEAEPYIPFDINEVDLGFHILQDVIEEGQKKMETILVAAKKDVLQSKLEILNELDLRTVVVDLDAFAVQNAYEINNENTTDTIVFINIGASVSNISIVEQNIPRVVRDIYISGNSFTKAIQRNLSCDFKTAEDLKTRYSILVTAEEKERTLAENQKEALQVSNAVISVLKDLLGEIHRSIDFYISQNPERSIQKIVLSGGSANLKNFDRYLNQELKIPVEIFNPLQQISNSETIPESIAPCLAVAIGLATRRENDIKK